MTRHLIPIACLLFQAAPVVVAEEKPAAKSPWDAVWTMDLKDQERTYVDFQGASYLLVAPDDFKDALFLNQKDVALPAKFSRLVGGAPAFFNLPQVQVAGGGAEWGSAVEGDNFFLLGRITAQGDRFTLTLARLVAAASDAQIIAERLAAVRKDDWKARLAVAEWATQQADAQGNRDFWVDAGREVVRQTVRDAATQAATGKDFALLLQAMAWAVDRAGDRNLAAEVGCAPWIREVGGEGRQSVEQYMGRLGFVFHEDDEVKAWMPLAKSLTRRFEKRFNALDWRDAEGFFQLGREMDKHADLLPNAQELSHRAYTKGLQANPSHNGLRRALGLEPVTDGQTAAIEDNVLRQEASGLQVPGPSLWSRSAKPLVENAAATWIDPASDTAFLAAYTVNAEAGLDLDAIWKKKIDDLQATSTKFTPVGAPSAVTVGGQTGRRMGYTYQESDYTRQGEVVVVLNPNTHVCLTLVLSFVAEEREGALQALEQVLTKTVIPASTPTPAPPPAPATPGPTTTPPADGSSAPTSTSPAPN